MVVYIMGASVGDRIIMGVEIMEETVVVLAVKTFLSAADTMLEVEIMGIISDTTAVMMGGTIIGTRVPVAVEAMAEAALETEQGGM